MVIDLESYSTAPGTRLVQRMNSSTLSVRWTVQEARSGIYYLRNNYSGHYLSLSGHPEDYMSTAPLSTATNTELWIMGAVGRIYTIMEPLRLPSVLPLGFVRVVDSISGSPLRIYGTGEGGIQQYWRLLEVRTDRRRLGGPWSPVMELTVPHGQQDVSYFQANIILSNPSAGSTIEDWALSFYLTKGLGGAVSVAGSDGAELVSARADDRGLAITVRAAEWSQKKTLRPGDTFTFELSGGAEQPDGDIRETIIKADQCRINGIPINL
jgi:hypothetical protein